MKKLSISVFAVVAIVFALSSAFTTTSKKFVREDYEMWIFSNSVGDEDDFIIAGDEDDKYDYVVGLSAPATVDNSNSGQTIAQYLDAKFSNPDKICVSTTSDELCVVKVLQETGTGPQDPGDGQVEAVEFGTLQDLD